MPRAREAIYNYLVGEILEGRISVNGAIPTESRLAEMFDANRMDARFAIRVLEQKGLVQRRKRRGTHLSRVPSPTLARDLISAMCREACVIASPGMDPIHWNHVTLQEIEKTLREEGYGMFQEGLPEKPTRADLEKLLKRISSRGATALLLMPTIDEVILYQENLDLLFQYHPNIFVFDYGGTPPEEWPFHVLSLHPFGEGAQVAQYLYDQGFEHVVFLMQEGASPVYWMTQRELGLRYGLLRASNGILKSETWRLPKEGAETCRSLVAGGKRYAVVAANDALAAAFLDQARAAGFDAPRDFALVSFDNNPQYRAYNLTTVAPPLARIGRMIGQLISGRLLRREEGNRICISVGSDIVERETCGASRVAVESSSAPASLEQVPSTAR